MLSVNWAKNRKLFIDFIFNNFIRINLLILIFATPHVRASSSFDQKCQIAWIKL
jgi:hypothetical protein